MEVHIPYRSDAPTSSPVESSVRAAFSRSDNVPPSPVWKFSAVGRQLLTISPTWIETSGGVGQNSVDHVAIESVMPLEDLRANCNSSFISASLSKIDETKYTLVIEPKQQDIESSIEFSHDIDLVARLQSREEVKVHGLSVTGRTPSSVIASPDRINFGILNKNADATTKIVVWSKTGDEFQIESARCEYEGATVNYVEEQKGVKVLKLNVGAMQLGNQEFSIKVHGRKENGKQFDILIPVHYSGTDGVSKPKESSRGV
jgi:hypothetical protein